MKSKGLHWAVRSQIVRLSGSFWAKKIETGEVDGFTQPMRTSDDRYDEEETRNQEIR